RDHGAVLEQSYAEIRAARHIPRIADMGYDFGTAVRPPHQSTVPADRIRDRPIRPDPNHLVEPGGRRGEVPGRHGAVRPKRDHPAPGDPDRRHLTEVQDRFPSAPPRHDLAVRANDRCNVKFCRKDLAGQAFTPEADPPLAIVPAGAAVLPIAAQVGASRSTAGEPGDAGDHACAVLADLAGTAGVVARSAVRRGPLPIDARAAARLQALLAGRRAHALVADLSRSAGVAARAAVPPVALQVHARTGAFLHALQAREHAASVPAEMSRWTRVPAAAAVARMG